MMAASATVAGKKQHLLSKEPEAPEFIPIIPTLKSRKQDINVEMFLNG
jgi:hypothetical protein